MSGQFENRYSILPKKGGLVSSPIEELGCQAETAGPFAFPEIFFNETFPRTCGFVLDAVEPGNSGKSVLKSLRWFFVLFNDGPKILTDVGVGRVPRDEDAAEPSD
jgi:hypothetical protein